MDEIITYMENNFAVEIAMDVKVNLAKKFLRYRIKILEWCLTVTDEELSNEIKRLKAKFKGGKSK